MSQTPFEQAAALLPKELYEAALGLPESVQNQAEEFRLRTGFRATVMYANREMELRGTDVIHTADLHDVLEFASRSSVHTVLEQLRHGFVTVKGGHRIGICGTAVITRGEVTGFRHLSSLNIRIAKEMKGVARSVVPALFEDGALQNTLILAPPGAGKTTLLRDVIRCISDGDGVPELRVGIADARGELAGIWEGAAQMELGRHTDILDGVAKSEGLLMLLRGMNPDVLAVDEITDSKDVEALSQATGCGVALLATAHGKSVKDLYLRPTYREMVRQNIFSRAVLIEQNEQGERKFIVEELPCCE